MTVLEAVLFVLSYGLLRLALPVLILFVIGALAQRHYDRIDYPPASA